MKYIRWMGAFRKKEGLHQALLHELNLSSTMEVAAEPIWGIHSNIPWARVGLLVSRSAIIKVWSGDVWSEYENGKLHKTSLRPSHNHGEAWVHPEYVAIVVKGSSKISKRNWKTLWWVSNLTNLPILDLDRNWKKIERR